MVFESFSEAHNFILISSFIIAFILGMVANKTNFCTMGAVSDAINIGSYDRMRAWLLAIAVAMIGVGILEFVGMLSLSSTFPPYRASNIIIAENIIGGLMFGIGMTFASGCGNKTIVRLGAGNMKSLVVMAIIALFAYYMINPFPNSDQTLYSLLFYGWVQHLTIPLSTDSDLGTVVFGSDASIAKLILALFIASGLLFYCFRSNTFRSSSNHMIAGLVVGLTVVSAWWVTSSTIDVDDDIYSLSAYYTEWEMLSDSEQGKPASARTLSTQSLTFINPIGQIYGYIKDGFKSSYFTFGLLSVFGVVLGSFLMSLITKSFRIEWFSSVKDFVNHAIGAILMGVGGTLSLGCTIGQGISGVSTLAIGSFMTFFAIVLGSALTMKTQYYAMVYDDESVYACLISAMADYHLLPNALRKLDAID